MQYQDREVVAAYGEAMLYSHLVEDMLKLILREATRFRANGYQAPIPAPWKLGDIINEFGRAFPDSAKLVERLHRLQKIRNKLTHALVPQVGSDLVTEEGRDQIQAMIERYVRHAAAARRVLGSIYESMLKQVVVHDFTLMFEGEIEEFDARVVKSEIQKLLDEVEEES
jgi:hypothetical protein